MAEDTCLFDLGGRAGERRMSLGLGDQDLYIITTCPPASKTGAVTQMTLDKDKPGHVSSRYNIRSLA